MDDHEGWQITVGPGKDWHCVAYGEDGGSWCFMQEVGPPCAALSICTELMAVERQRVWQKIQEGAATGDPDMKYLDENISGPDELLGGSNTPRAT